MGKLKISALSTSTNVTYPNPQNDRFVNPDLIGGVHEGGTGGLTGNPGQQIQPTVFINKSGAVQSLGSITEQKGAHKFEVTDGTYTGKCTLVNSATLVAGQMNIQINLTQATFANLLCPVGTATVAAFVTYAAANVSAYSAIGATSVLTGTGLTGTVTVANVSTSGGLTTAWINFPSQTVANVLNTLTINNSIFASRISNKFVSDFGSDGQPNSTSSQLGNTTYYTSGYNPNKYRYHLAAPTSTFVQVQSA